MHTHTEKGYLTKTHKESMKSQDPSHAQTPRHKHTHCHAYTKSNSILSWKIGLPVQII